MTGEGGGQRQEAEALWGAVVPGPDPQPSPRKKGVEIWYPMQIPRK